MTAKSTGIKLEVLTTAAGVQFYTGQFMDEAPGIGGRRYGKHAGLALEAHGYPDAINKVS